MGSSDYSRTRRDSTSTGRERELEAVGFSDVVEIGRGGFGAVYRCTQSDLHRSVAVKVLETVVVTGVDSVVGEQVALGRLTGHPNIVNVFDVDKTFSGRPYIVMPYLRQGSLDGRIRSDGPLGVEAVLRLGIKLSSALDAAHRIGILHCDVKPANVLTSDYGEPLLSDFGIARIAGGAPSDQAFVAGSPAYVAPEVFGGVQLDEASDVYGLGATLYCALTGHAPYQRLDSESTVELLRRVVSQPPEPPQGIREADDVVGLVLAAMSRVPGARPSALSFAAQLQQLQIAHGFAVDEMPTTVDSAPTPTSPFGTRISSGHHSIRSSPSEGNLPAETTSFVDRRSELTKVRRLLENSRLVTLTGTGGVGKTRLAIRVGAKSRRRFHDGVWFVELGDLQDGSLLPEILVGSLHVRVHPSMTALEALLASLKSSKLLLVLDNCEQLVDAVAATVDTVLRQCPDVRVLATSREALGLGGEKLLHVPPLLVMEPQGDLKVVQTQNDAVSLFVERASLVAELDLTSTAYATAARICKELEGLPLAIELAAARFNSMSLEQILERLSQPYSLLTHGRRQAPERQRTLLSTIDWSHDLCSEEEQRTWARMSVFAGSFELDAAEGVLGGGTDSGVLDVLSSLVDKSILVRDAERGHVRFRMLDTIRRYGAELLESSGESARWHRRHLLWYSRLAKRADRAWVEGRQREAGERLDRELANIRSAQSYEFENLGRGDLLQLEVANALFRFWLSRGMLGEGRRWLDRASAVNGGVPVETGVELAKALSANTTLASLQGDLDAAHVHVEQAWSIERATPDSRIHGHVVHAEGFLSLFTGDLTKAQNLLAEANSTFIDLDDVGARFEVLVKLGWAYALADEYESAVVHFENAREITARYGEEVYQSYALRGIGFTLWRLGDRPGALAALQQALALSRSRGDPFEAALCMESMAWVVFDDGDVEKAATLMALAVVLVKAPGSSTVAFPALIAYHDEYLQKVEQSLGANKIDSINRKAASLGLDSAAALALNEVPMKHRRPREEAMGLTKRENEIARLVSQGLTNRAIAGQLVISVRTVDGHVEHILTKLGFDTRAQIAAWVTAQDRVDR